jgi:16S rRNA (guanine966-N2)-methyltransferase
MMRITGGQWRGRTLESPPGDMAKTSLKGAVRPTTGIVRQSLFNQLQGRLAGARFLDGFAGSGIMGFEALSRGASHVTALEHHGPNARRILRNAEVLKLTPEQFECHTTDTLRWLDKPCPVLPYDIVFLDPPYGFKHWEYLVTLLNHHGWVALDGVITIEQGAHDLVLPGFSRRVFGDSVLGLFEMGRDLLDE